MTAQETEAFHYENEDYGLFAFGDDNIMAHNAFGVERMSLSTALERGFRSTYGVDKDNKLVVKSLYLDGKVVQPIAGVEPFNGIGYTVYKDLNVVLPFTGHVFIGNTAAFFAYHGTSFIGEAIKAYELTVNNSEVIEKTDFSEQLNTKLKELSPLPQAEHDYSIDTHVIFQQLWDRVSQFLPRRYRFIYIAHSSYCDFEWATNPDNWSGGRRKRS